MSVITSKISPIVLGSGRSKTTVYTSTRTTKLGDGTFHVDILQYSNAKGQGGRVIGVRDPGNPNKITWNSKASGRIKSNQKLIKEASKTQMQSMRKDFVTNAQEAERYNSAQGNRNTAITDEGIWPEYLKSGPSDPMNNFGTALKTATGKSGNADCARQKYHRELVYPTVLRKQQQDTLRISVLKYEPRKVGGGFKFKSRSKTDSRVIGSVTLPAPGGINDANATAWGQSTMTPLQMVASDAVKASLGEGGMKAAMDSLEGAMEQVMGDKENVKKALQSAITGNITGVSDLLARTEGMVQNPNMELLFSGPQLRPFSFTYKLSPRDEPESMNVLKIIRMFKQSMAAQTTPASIFLKASNTYKLEFLSPRSNKEHRFLPKIKECALNSFNVNYTPDGSYMTYENSSMVAYELSFSFTEIEPIYNNDYTNLDGDGDTSIGY